MRHAFPGSGGQFRGRELTLEAVGRTFCPDLRPGTRPSFTFFQKTPISL